MHVFTVGRFTKEISCAVCFESVAEVVAAVKAGKDRFRQTSVRGK
jgi:hypothetical protein